MPEAQEDISIEIATARPGGPRNWWTPAIETIVATMVVAIILLLLTQAGQTFETNSILIAILPVLFSFASGKLASFKAFGVELKSAIRQVSSETIEADHSLSTSSAIEFVRVPENAKESIEKIQNYVQQRVPAISFELGWIITKRPRLRNILTSCASTTSSSGSYYKDDDGRFEGLISAEKLHMLGELSEPSLGGYQKIVADIKRGNVRDLPGFIKSKLALAASSTKGYAIESSIRRIATNCPWSTIKANLLVFSNRGQLLGSVLASILRAANASS